MFGQCIQKAYFLSTIARALFLSGFIKFFMVLGTLLNLPLPFCYRFATLFSVWRTMSICDGMSRPEGPGNGNFISQKGRLVHPLQE